MVNLSKGTLGDITPSVLSTLAMMVTISGGIEEGEGGEGGGGKEEGSLLVKFTSPILENICPS